MGSSHWRFTCSFEKHGVDYRDYLRGSFKEVDPTNFTGKGVCKKVEYINIRGHAGHDTTVPFWQFQGQIFHTDSFGASCKYDGTPGAVQSEDNFGLYGVNNVNEGFRCTSSPTSTTQHWFGGYL